MIALHLRNWEILKTNNKIIKNLKSKNKLHKS